MKSYFFTLLLLPFLSFGQVNFNDYFSDKALRIDVELAGTATKEMVLLKDMKQEPYWAGNPHYLVPKSQNGDYRITMKTPEGKLLYAKGFNSLFREWQTTPEAKKHSRGFYHALQLPFPKTPTVVSIDSRQKNGSFVSLFEKTIAPDDYHIYKEETTNYKVDTVSYAGVANKHLDLVFIAEGYTQEELPKFQKDVRRFQQWIFSVVPYSEYKDKVNIYAILSPSEHSGPDIPGENVYHNTLLNSSFYTFNSPRYLTVRDTKKMWDIAAQVPYDHVYVIVNTNTYGGAGFYNTYTSCASDCRKAEEIASHELGHGLIGLADEYFYTTDEAGYYYDLDIEPWERNITTLVDFDKKWKHLVKKGTPIPTPHEEKYLNTIGAFKRDASKSKGICTPMQDCKMKSNNTNKFCPACKEIVRKVMDTYVTE